MEEAKLDERLASRARTIGEVAQWYGVSVRTVQRWLVRAGLGELARRRGTGSFFYTPAELERIAGAIGE